MDMVKAKRFRKTALVVLGLLVLATGLLAWKFQVFYAGPSLDLLQSQFAKQGHVDSDAPVQAHDEIIINAPVSRVWQVLSDVSGWHTWFPGVSNVQWAGSLSPDLAFSWENDGAKIESIFSVVIPEKELSWIGSSSGAHAVDRHVLEAVGPNQTKVFNEESMGGPLLTLFYSSDTLHTGMKQFLLALKQTCEKSN